MLWSLLRCAALSCDGLWRAGSELTLPLPPPYWSRYVVPLLWLPVATALCWRGVVAGGLPLAALPVAFVAGVLIWQLMEYSIHK